MDHVCCFIPSTRTRCRAAGLAVTALLGLGCKDAPTLTAPPPSGARALQAAATVTVNSTADAVDANPGDGLCATVTGVCTLRAAIQEANALPGDDVISLPPGTYTLTIAGAGEDAAARGDLDITSNVSIQGGGFVGTTIIDGNGGVTGDRVFHVMHGAKADFGGVTIQGGRVHDSGGGIRNDGGAVFLNFVGVLGNRAGENGGGIENDRGDFQIFHSFVRHNSAARCGGGIDNAVGGSTLFVHYTGVTDNTAELAGGGIANRGRPGTPVTTASLEFLLTLTPNSAPRGRDVLNTTFATFAGLAGAPADKIGDLLDNVTEEHVCHPTAIHH